MKKLFIAILCLLALSCLTLLFPKESKKKVIGVVVPMEHEALEQIVDGFKKELSIESDVTVKVMNAQGDATFQKNLIEQLLRMKCDLFVPIGTSTSQMTLKLASNSQVVCLAADPGILASENTFDATGLDDNVFPGDSLAFVSNAFPKFKKVTLIYSSSEKVAKEIPLFEKEALLRGVFLQKLMVQSMSELYTISQRVAKDSDAIFLFKDHLVVSGISVLVKQAEKRKIPLITSDEGSIIAGGAFALGVKESKIGSIGALMVKETLKGKSPKMMPFQKVDMPSLFINRSSCLKQGVDLVLLENRAQEMNLPIEYVKEKEVEDAL